MISYDSVGNGGNGPFGFYACVTGADKVLESALKDCDIAFHKLLASANAQELQQICCHEP
jgi:hypothetical protein